MYFLSPGFLGFTWNCLSSEIKRAQNRNMFGHFFLNSRQKRVSRWSRSDGCETVPEQTSPDLPFSPRDAKRAKKTPPPS